MKNKYLELTTQYSLIFKFFYCGIIMFKMTDPKTVSLSLIVI